MFQAEHLQEKWSPVLEHPDLPKIEDAYKRSVTTVILENQEKALREDSARMHQRLPILVRGKLKPGGVYIEFCVDHNGTLSSAVLTHPPAPAKRDPFLGNPAPSCIPPTYPPSPPQAGEQLLETRHRPGRQPVTLAFLMPENGTKTLTF